jgi:hypothetical protein
MGPPLKGGVYQLFQWGMSLVSEGDFSTTRWGLKKSLFWTVARSCDPVITVSQSRRSRSYDPRYKIKIINFNGYHEVT